MSNEIKTKKNDGDVEKFLDSVADKKRRKDAIKLNKIFQEVTGEKPAMWGSSIVGFGSYHYKYASGREGDWMRVGFSPRKQALTLYLLSGLNEYSDGATDPLLEKLGKHTTGKGCLYIKSLADVDENVLRELIKKSYKSKAMGET